MQIKSVSEINPMVMKKTCFALLASSILLITGNSAFAQYTGIFGDGVAITSDINDVSTFNLYETAYGGNGLNVPNPYSGGGVTMSSAPTAVNGLASNLGTFILGVDTLTLNGGDILTYKGDGANVSGAQIGYGIYNSDDVLVTGFTTSGLTFNQDEIAGSGSSDNQRWYSDGAGVNMLNDLSAGTYTLNVYYQDFSSVNGSDYDNNGGGNYKTTFTVETEPTPEPSTAMLGMSGLATLYLIRRRR